MSRDRRDTLIGIALGLLAVAAIIAMMRWIAGTTTTAAPSPSFLPLGPRGQAPERARPIPHPSAPTLTRTFASVASACR